MSEAIGGHAHLLEIIVTHLGQYVESDLLALEELDQMMQLLAAQETGHICN